MMRSPVFKVVPGLVVALSLSTSAVAYPTEDAVEARVLIVGVHAPNVQATIDIAADGDVVEIPAGVWSGPVLVDRAIVLRGTGGEIDGRGKGTVVKITAPEAIIENITIQGSGSNLSGVPPDSCVHVDVKAEGAIVRGNTLQNCSFGIWVHNTRDVTVSKNRIIGPEKGHRSNRGNGIQLFDSRNLVVKGNHITGGRDGIYISATRESLIANNRMERTRYGVHYMFSYTNVLRANEALGNDSGFALMQSHHLTIVDNVASDNKRNGILIRDARNSTITGSTLERNGEGLFFYGSNDNLIADNRIAHNDVGARIWAGSVNNRVTRNAFIGNRRQIFYSGLSDLHWGIDDPGNLWGDYLGWDQDGDGIGDRPYRVDSFTTNLLHRFPAVALLLRSPSLELLGHMEQRLPLLRVPTVIDHAPLIAQERTP
ncbi:MAG: nitrous oxide reductase family maturation protein NosD [Bradymonadaceae bacterium]